MRRSATSGAVVRCSRWPDAARSGADTAANATLVTARRPSRRTRDLAGSLCRGRDPGPEGAALLAGLHRDVIVMTRASLPDSLSDYGAIASRPERFQLLWHNGEVAFWKVVRK